MSLPLFRIISTLGVAATQAATLSKCSPFHLPKPELLGPSILEVQADEVHNHSAVSLGPGFATTSTDGGHDTGAEAVPTDLTWSLKSKNNLDWHLFEDYASKATNDIGVIGKEITKSYYKKAAKYSYFAGCSGGGRQGLMMAQDYPDVFDGTTRDLCPYPLRQKFIGGDPRNATSFTYAK